MDKIYSVNGPVVKVADTKSFAMQEMVYVGKSRLVGEVIRMNDRETTIQVYEETGGLKAGEPVESTGGPLSVTLGPGILRNIYDGIQRPLPAIESHMGSFIERGAHEPSLDTAAKWDVTVNVKAGDTLTGGQIYATCPETPAIQHRCMVPPEVCGTVTWAAENGSYTVNDPIVKLTDAKGREHTLTLCQKWPIRTPRPAAERMTSPRPLITGQRVIDTMFPLAKGGTAAIPGPFGSGKTVMQHQLAKWSDVDIVVYIGCGERGNEMTDVLREFPELTDPRTGESLMKRTVLIANTSDMPVAAREASVYTGITIAEYFRDMGYDVAVIADSTSRWAEALREMSGRLEEMPGEEGYPAYLASRLAQFYERAGVVRCMGTEERTGSLTAVGAVSPPGGDLSEPVAQATMRIVKVFWSLDASLAYRRHFPAINWLNSYSLYLDAVAPWFNEHLGPEFMKDRNRAMHLLQEENELNEIVQLVGKDSLSPKDQLTLEIARMLREDFLQQNAFMDVDSYSSFDRQLRLLALILHYEDLCRDAIAKNVELPALFAIPARERLGWAKYAAAEEYAANYQQVHDEMDSEIAALIEKAGEDA